MRLKMTGILLFCAGVLSAGQHLNEVSGPVKDAGALEIVVERSLPVVNYAAKELQTYLKQATGKSVPVVKKASGGKTALILGDCPSARAAGIDVKKLPDEGYRILRKGNCVFIAGQDDPQLDPRQFGWWQYYRRATLSGVYDFLERFAGVGFFFPGRYGTVVPARKGLFLPEKINILESPDMPRREFYIGHNAKTYDPKFKQVQLRALEWQRLRLSENKTVFSHGMSKLNLIERFSKTHPEYFALRDDGKRYFEPEMQHTGQLCFNSGVREEIYQDIKAYYTKRPASERGIKAWQKDLAYGKYFCVTQQDGMYWCRCEKCRKVCDPKKAYTPEGKQAISNFMFRFILELTERMKKDGIDGILVYSIYPPHDTVPDCRIPENVKLTICINGTVDENRKSDDLLIRSWNQKSGIKFMSWTYAMGKHMKKKIPNIPQMMPREAARFITTYRNYLDGVFWESESDRYLFNYLNYYITSKMMWNTSLDVEKLLDDHYKLMFGKGGPMVKEVFDELENCWIKGIVNHTVMDELGPKVQVAGDQELWTKIYSPEKLARFEKLFDQAQRAAASDKGAAERLKFIRQQILDPVLQAQRKFQSAQTALDSWRVYCPGSIYLRPSKGEVNEVNTRVDIAKKGNALVIRFDCEEPRMNELVAIQTGRDNPDTWKDSEVEFFINPSGDRKNYYHFVVNANGALTDYRCELDKKADMSWNSSATVKAEKGTAGWKVEVRIPLKDLGPLAKVVPVNFARHRALNRKPAANPASYQWSSQSGSLVRGFHNPEAWGTLSFSPETEKYLLKFDCSVSKLPSCWRSGGAKGGQIYNADKRIFISSGKSLHMKNVKGKKMAVGFKLPEMKPNTRYQVSYFIRTKDLKGKNGARAFLSFNQKNGITLPAVHVTGTHSWHRLSFNVTSPKNTGEDSVPVLRIWVNHAEGEAWFDQIEVKELQ